MPTDDGNPEHGLLVPNANRALGILFLLGVINYLDRIALSILQVPIKVDLHLSDTQLGILTGIAFFIPYTLFSGPLGRLADHVKRKQLLAAVLALWSAATALISVAQGFGSLLLLRMGVALGEAGCVPASYSLLADYFAPTRRARAFAVFVLAFPVGSMIGLAGVGALGGAIGWRHSFLAIGVLGLLLAPIVLMTLREPQRGESDRKPMEPAAAMPSVAATLRMLWHLKSFRYLALAATFQAYVVGAILSWGPPFYVRAHHLSLSSVALLFGAVVGVGGGIGSYLGGVLGGKLALRDRRWYVWVPALACGLVIPVGLVQLTAASVYVSFTCGLASALLMNIFIAPSFALANSLVAPNVRGFTSATLLASTAIMGSGLGPFVTGVLSDYGMSHYGLQDGSLRYAIGAALPCAGIAAWLFMRAAAHLKPIDRAHPMERLPELSEKPSA